MTVRVGTLVDTLTPGCKPLRVAVSAAQRQEAAVEKGMGGGAGPAPPSPGCVGSGVLLTLPSGLGNGAEPMAAPGLQPALVSGTWHGRRHPSLVYDRDICFPAWEREGKNHSSGK